jgi:predicted CXXCH cytochrome family protein
MKLDYHKHLDGDASCTNCHNPHAANGPSLLAAQQKDLCTKCHFANLPAKVRSRAITHPDLVCTTCHKPHGADNEKMLVKTDWELCRGCHPDTHKSTHPMGPETVDPRTKGPVTCLSCHKLHGSEFKSYLPLNPDGDLCVQCHRK